MGLHEKEQNADKPQPKRTNTQPIAKTEKAIWRTFSQLSLLSLCLKSLLFCKDFGDTALNESKHQT